MDPLNQLKILRDKGLEALKVPLPEKTFVQAHTGGAANGAITSLPRNVLKEVKRVWEQKPERARMRDEDLADAKRFQREVPGPGADERLRYAQANKNYYRVTDQSPNMVDGYGGSRDLRMTLGNFGVYFDKKGNVVIKDTWKVDSDLDIVEGGLNALRVHNAAKAVGSYRPMPIEIRLTKEEWDSL